MTKLELFGLVLPEIKKGDDLASLIVHEAERRCGGVQENDIIIVTSKIISKAKGYIIPMPKKFSRDAIFLSKITKKPLWECELILKLSRRIVAAIPTTEIILRFNLHKILSKNPERAKKVLMEDPVILVVENARGSLCSDAELDLSNVPKGFVYLPPPDPDLEARELREKIENITSKHVAVIVTDTEVSPFKIGSVDIAVGSSGIVPISRKFASPDMYGHLKYGGVDVIVDELASAAALLMGQTAEGIPVVIVRGLTFEKAEKMCIKNILLSRKILHYGIVRTLVSTFWFKLRMLVYKIFRLK